MEIKEFNRYLVAGLVINAVLCVFTILSFLGFKTRLVSYRPPFPVSEQDILRQVSESTYQYLTNREARISSSVSDSISYSPSFYSTDLSISTTWRGYNIGYIDGVEYMEGDYIKLDDTVWTIVKMDFERQRMYCSGPSNATAVVAARSPRSQAVPVSGAPDGNSAEAD